MADLTLTPEEAAAQEAQKQAAEKAEAEKAAKHAAKSAKKAKEMSPAEKRAKAGSHPGGFQNSKKTEPVPSKLDPKKVEAAAKKLKAEK